MSLPLEDLTKILLAVVLGALIGAEREYHDKAAGFRTNIFICVGATLFTIVSLELGGAADPVRIASGIVTGVGFLGAGVILRSGGRIVGLTTASIVWLTAAVGMAVGAGTYLLAIASTLTMLIVLWGFPHLERHIDVLREHRTYELALLNRQGEIERIEAIFAECGLHWHLSLQSHSPEELTCAWQVNGSPANQRRLVERLMADPAIQRFRYED